MDDPALIYSLVGIGTAAVCIVFAIFAWVCYKRMTNGQSYEVAAVQLISNSNVGREKEFYV